MQTGQIEITNAASQKHTIRVWLAKEDDERSSAS